jgi:hypothetical protein
MVLVVATDVAARQLIHIKREFISE